MPDLGRWYGMDQLSEMYHDSSPYAYVGNNPIMFVDPDGRCKNRPEGEPCPESPGGSKNPVNIEEVVVGQTYPTDNSPASPPYTGPSFLSFLSSYYGGSSGAAGGGGGGAPVDPWVQYRKDLADYNLMRSRQTLYNAIGDQRDDLHVLLGGLGNIPVFGELFDGLDGAIYALRGDNVNAAASFSAMIPLIGTGTKYTIKGVGKITAKGLIGPGLKIADNKLIQHAHQWGIAEKGAALTTEQLGLMRNLSNHIYKNASTIRQGVWGNPAAGGFNNALFYSNRNHIVVTQSDGMMITILRNATGNKHFNNATTIWAR